MNQKGFAIVSVIAFLPVLVALLISLSQIALFINSRSTVLLTCRKGLLSIQEGMAKSLTQLQSLNPKARNLRTQQAIIKANLAVALVSFPLAVPGLRAELAANRAQQALLRSQQLSIISAATVRSNQQIGILKNKLTANQTTSTTARLAVEPLPRSAIAPDYEPVTEFEKNQAITLKWKIDTKNYLNALFEDERTFPALRGECIATISKNRRNQWTEKLGMASL